MADIGTVGSSKWKTFIARGAQKMERALTDEQLDLIATHCTLLIQWNKKTNLTRITDPLAVAVKHVLDSMAAAPLITEKDTLLDVGSGGGFPGMILKILMPSAKVTLLDASRKKVSFLNHIIRTLGLKHITAIHKRTEDLAKSPEFQHAFNVVTCRSFAGLDVFFTEAVNFMSADGKMIAYKQKDIAREINKLKDVIRMTNLSMDIIPYVLPVLKLERVLVLLKHPT